MTRDDAFIAAVGRGDLAAVEAALERDPSLAAARDEAGVSLICLAVYRGHAGVADLLRRHRDCLDVFEATLLGEARAVEALLQEQPDRVNALSPDGFQPLGLACFFGQRDVFELLLARGADIESPSQNDRQVRPIHGAVAHADPRIALKLTRRLLAAGASADVRQRGGVTPLHEAARRGHEELVAVLMRHGGDASVRDDEGRTPADLAREHGHAEVLRLLSR